MQKRVSDWMRFLRIDEDTVQTLREFKLMVEPEFDGIMSQVYDRLVEDPDAVASFGSDGAMRRARQAQKDYWLGYVLAGEFHDGYGDAAGRVGFMHFARRVDLLRYMGTYEIVLEHLVDFISGKFPDDAAARRRFNTAVKRAAFMDMGLATSIYYETQVEEVGEIAGELNASLARAGEYRDNETGRHIMRMSRMCGALARDIGKDAAWVALLVAASPLHDVGKIGVPDAILLKPGRLDSREMEIMRRHPLIGGIIIPQYPAEVIRMARRIALSHHERWDGGGYPTGLEGEEIPLEGRIAAICDVFDALVSKRPYKEAWPVEKAIDFMRENAGKHFDPDLIEAFLGIIPAIMDIQKEYAEP